MNLTDISILSEEQTRELISNDLSEFDAAHMTEIIRENYGDGYAAKLLRCLHILLPHADSHNMNKLIAAYPGAVAAYRIWYNDPESSVLLGGIR